MASSADHQSVRLGPRPGPSAMRASADLLTGSSGQTISARHLQHAAHSSSQIKGHQRRQSVARLLPDISKLRLLSWLVEASSELISCDIAIMDGVYAKLNLSQESLLFWNHHQHLEHEQRRPPAPPALQPVANSLLISQHLKQQRRQVRHHQAARNHHSLPIAHYDPSSLATSPPVTAAQPGPPTSSGAKLKSKAAVEPRKPSLSGLRSASLPSAAPSPILGGPRHANHHQSSDDDLHTPGDDQDDDSNSSASSSSTASSGIHAGGTSLSSSASRSSSSSSAGSGSWSSHSPAHHLAAAAAAATAAHNRRAVPRTGSSAQQLSEKIRQVVIEHNRLQSLLINIIRQHDRQRELDRRRLQHPAVGKLGGSNAGCKANGFKPPLRIDLVAIVAALDDGCLCLCHSQRRRSLLESVETGSLASRSLSVDDKSSRLPSPARSSDRARLASLVRQQVKQQQKLQRANSSTSNGNNNNNSNANSTNSTNQSSDKVWSNEAKYWQISSSNRKKMINLLSDKLCEDCFEAHYWLHGVGLHADELYSEIDTSMLTLDLESGGQHHSSSSSKPLPVEEVNALIARRNATLVKLVQQEVRSTISKSIDLIDLIRREIKSPEYIKQKQLMKYFSSSIQLLTSVSNYVVPSQDISSFIPDNMLDQQQTNLFKLPSNDFDYLLLSSSPSTSSSSNYSESTVHSARPAPSSSVSQSITGTKTALAVGHYQDCSLGTVANNQLPDHSLYHLASAPEIPIRLPRTNNPLKPSANRQLLSRAASCVSQDSSIGPGSISSLPATLSQPSTPSNSSSATTTTSIATADHQVDNRLSPEQQQPQKVGLDQSPTGSDKQQTIQTNLNSHVKTTTQVSDGSRSTLMSPVVLLASATQATTVSGSPAAAESSSSGASSNNSSASSSIARGAVQQSSIMRSVKLNKSSSTIGCSLSDMAAPTKPSQPGGSLRLDNRLTGGGRPDLSSFEAIANLSAVRQKTDDDIFAQSRGKFWKSNKFNFIKKLLHVKQQRLLRQQSKDRRIYNSKVQSKFRLVMMDLTHFNKSQQLLSTENGVNSLLTSMRNVLEFGLYLTLKLY